MDIRQRSRRLNLLGQAENHGDAITRVTKPGDAFIVFRGLPRSLILMCPCGCGDVLTLNLDRRSDKAWLLYRRKAGITLYPSVWRDSGCESHFVVWRNQITWIDDREIFEDNEEVTRLLDGVLACVPTDRFVEPEWIAEKLGADPWDVVHSCRRLVWMDKLEEGERTQKDTFRKRSDVSRAS